MPTSIDYAFGDYAKAMKAPPPTYHLTTQKLLSMGMCLCSTCGTPSSSDYKYCKQCNEPILILTEK